jgi:hypothetical protein
MARHVLIALLLLWAPAALGAEPAPGPASRAIDPWAPWPDGWPPYIVDWTALHPLTVYTGKPPVFPHLPDDSPPDSMVRDPRALERPTLGDLDVTVPGPWIVGAPLWLKLTFHNPYDQRIIGPGKLGGPFNWWCAVFYVFDPATGQEIAYRDCNIGTKDGPYGGGGTLLSAPPHGTLTIFHRLLPGDSEAFAPNTANHLGSLEPVLKMPAGKQRWTVLYRNHHGDRRFVLFRGSVEFDARPATEAEHTYFKPLSQFDGPRGPFEAPADAPAELHRALAMDWLLIALEKMPTVPTVANIDRLARQLEVPEFFGPLLDALRFSILRRDLGPTVAAWRTTLPPRGGGTAAGFHTFTAQGFAALAQTEPWREAAPIKERALQAEPGLAWLFEWGLAEDLDDLAALRKWARDQPQTRPAAQPAGTPAP